MSLDDDVLHNPLQNQRRRKNRTMKIRSANPNKQKNEKEERDPQNHTNKIGSVRKPWGERNAESNTPSHPKAKQQTTNETSLSTTHRHKCDLSDTDNLHWLVLGGNCTVLSILVLITQQNFFNRNQIKKLQQQLAGSSSTHHIHHKHQKPPPSPPAAASSRISNKDGPTRKILMVAVVVFVVVDGDFSTYDDVVNDSSIPSL